jgi:hypothetical protein
LYRTKQALVMVEERSPDVPPRVAAIGRGPSVEALAVGPWGAVVAVGAHGAAVAAPRGLVTRVAEAIDGASVRFSVDGDRALAAVEDGAIEIDLATGRVTRRWAGSLLPVGWLGAEPWFLDAARAAVVDTRGEVRIAGFGGVPATRGGGWLAGPGAALWQLGQETPLRRGIVDGLVATDGEHLYQVLGADVRAVPTHAEGDGELLFRHDLTAAAEPGLEVSDDAEAGTSLVAAHLTGDAGGGWALHLHAEDGDGAAWHLPHGAPAGRAQPPPEPTLPKGVQIAGEHEESSVKLGRRRFPLPADGVAVVEGGHWVWTDAGMLVAL